MILKGPSGIAITVIIKVTILITPMKVLITILTKSHDPPSRRILMTGQGIVRVYKLSKQTPRPKTASLQSSKL